MIDKVNSLGIRLNTGLSLDHVTQVVSIVCPSRSGSSLFKYCLSRHPLVSSLAGEEEPYYKLAGNGYPWHKSDKFSRVNNAELVRLLMANELHNYNSVENRRALQVNDIEEQPWVEPVQCHITPRLILKTPQNIYRRGVMEQLFPKAEIKYLFLHRGFVQTINGLLDGWNSDYFQARKISGFSKNWWKFDMPPDWETRVDDPLEDIAFWQWYSAISHGLEDYKDAYRLPFEKCIRNGLHSMNVECNKVWSWMGLPRFCLVNLPEIMITDKPKLYRWMEKRPWLYHRYKNSARKTMSKLGYTPDSSKELL